MADPETNKQTVIAYYNMAFNERKPAEAAQKYGGPHYIQHNPQAPDGFEAFVGFVEGFAEQFPQMSLEIKRAVVGTGHAEKPQVEAMVRRLLPGAEIRRADAADALAVAICHAHHRATRLALARVRGAG